MQTVIMQLSLLYLSTYLFTFMVRKDVLLNYHHLHLHVINKPLSRH